jgi:hypothetical protein
VNDLSCEAATPITIQINSEPKVQLACTQTAKAQKLTALLSAHLQGWKRRDFANLPLGNSARKSKRPSRRQ